MISEQLLALVPNFREQIVVGFHFMYISVILRYTIGYNVAM